MKIASLRKKNIINFVLTGILLVIFCGTTYYNITQNNSLQSRVDAIKSEDRQLRNQTLELQSKTIEIKKYKELWRVLPASRKSAEGIKVDDVNAKLASIGDKYSINSPSVKITLPEPLTGGLFDRSTINVLLTKISLSFEAVDDSRAIMFVNDFANSLPGYLLITSFEIKKDKNYSSKDLVAISLGKGSGIIKGKVEFLWYAYKNKESDKKLIGDKNDSKAIK